MTIEINRPEVEALIQERLQQGGFKDPQDVILQALHASEPSRLNSAHLLAALRTSPAEDADEAPTWLKASWASAHASGLDAMTTEEIDAEIAVARQARRQTRP